jgi:hypothetical protein
MATHEGWSNYQTWCVNLWLQNEEGLYRETTQQAKDFVEQNDGEAGDDGGNGLQLVNEAERDMARWLKGFVAESKPELKGMFADLLQSAIDEVDFDEIATEYIREALEERAA